MARYGHIFYISVIAILLGIGLWRWPRATESQPQTSPQESTPTTATRNVAQQETLTQKDEFRRFHTALLEKTEDYSHLTWLGQPIWQSPLDLWTLQETIFEVKPDVLIECGTFRGGSSLFFAQLFDVMGHGRVITIDIQKLHNLSHPRVLYLIGNSVSPEIVQRVRDEVSHVKGPVMVVLDSDHSKKHVLRELEAYHDFVTPGSFLHVQDGVIDELPIMRPYRPGPLAAIEEFLRDHDEFEVDQERCERFLITHHPKGWLRRKTQASN
jgi:cephalosporin hydroxylase